MTDPPGMFSGDTVNTNQKKITVGGKGKKRDLALSTGRKVKQGMFSGFAMFFKGITVLRDITPKKQY